MPRLTVLNSRDEFIQQTAELTGVHILSNAVFDGGSRESVRLNFALPNSSVVRFDGDGEAHRTTFARDDPPFDLGDSAVLLSASQFSAWQENFGFAQTAFEGALLGQIGQANPRNVRLLQEFQEHSSDFILADWRIANTATETALLADYLEHPNAIQFIENGAANDRGDRLLQHFTSAAQTYSSIPELRGYLVQDDVAVENIGPAGEQFRDWLQQNTIVSDCRGNNLGYVAYNLCPLRMTGADFRWSQLLPDTRKFAVDLLMQYEGLPVWTEVKMQNDRWTSSALQQILLYGSMLSGFPQQRRFGRAYPQFLETCDRLLGVVVQQQDDAAFQADYEQAKEFARTDEFRVNVGGWFGGVLFSQVANSEDGWAITDFELVRCNC